MHPLYGRILKQRAGSGAVGRPGFRLTPPPDTAGDSRQLLEQQCEASRVRFIADSQTDHPEYVTGSGDQADLTDAGLTAFYASNPLCAPAAPQPQPTPDAQGLSITAPADGSTITTSMPTIAGGAHAGDRVRVAVDGGTWQTVTADANGAWSVPWEQLLPGSHIATVTLDTDPGNGVSINFRIDAAGTGDQDGGSNDAGAAHGGPASLLPSSISPTAAGVGAGVALLLAWLAGR